MLRRLFRLYKPVPLGRWCHKDYNKKCRSDIKSDLANIDNSGHMTGLCKKTQTISKKSTKTYRSPS